MSFAPKPIYLVYYPNDSQVAQAFGEGGMSISAGPCLSLSTSICPSVSLSVSILVSVHSVGNPLLTLYFFYAEG